MLAERTLSIQGLFAARQPNLLGIEVPGSPERQRSCSINLWRLGILQKYLTVFGTIPHF